MTLRARRASNTYSSEKILPISAFALDPLGQHSGLLGKDEDGDINRDRASLCILGWDICLYPGQLCLLLPQYVAQARKL